MKLTKYQLKVLRIWLRYNHSGYGFDQLFRNNWKMMLVLTFMIAWSIFIIVNVSPTIGWGFFGFFIGTFLRDITYFRLSHRAWPLTVDIIDWKRAQESADAYEKPVESK